MIRKCLSLIAAMLLICTFPTALADDTGALTEGELSAWVSRVLLSTKDAQPVNAPVGEESLTEDGYAFIYDQATLYYDKPVLDQSSVLQAITVTDEGLASPRGIKLGDEQKRFLSIFGWQNPALEGDESLAPLYVVDQLPSSAYWAWAQREGEKIASVQCAIHAGTGDGYTDAGVRYTFSGGKIDAIHVYGLTKIIALEAAISNAETVKALMGDIAPTQVRGNEQSEFNQDDLKFSGMDYRTLNETVATQVFGEMGYESWKQDDTSEWMHTTERTDVMITYIADADKQNERADALLIVRPGFDGPRGIRIGDSIDNVTSLFKISSEVGIMPSGATTLYGDGVNPPYAIMENNGEATVTVNYCAIMDDAAGEKKPVNLYLTFFDGFLSEMMIYSWQ